MRTTTKNLIDRLNAAGQYPHEVSEADCLGDSEMVRLRGGYVLFIDEDTATPMVSLAEQMEVGGNVEVASWFVDDDAVIDAIVAAALDV